MQQMKADRWGYQEHGWGAQTGCRSGLILRGGWFCGSREAHGTMRGSMFKQGDAGSRMNTVFTLRMRRQNRPASKLKERDRRLKPFDERKVSCTCI